MPILRLAPNIQNGIHLKTPSVNIDMNQPVISKNTHDCDIPAEQPVKTGHIYYSSGTFMQRRAHYFNAAVHYDKAAGEMSQNQELRATGTHT